MQRPFLPRSCTPSPFALPSISIPCSRVSRRLGLSSINSLLPSSLRSLLLHRTDNHPNLDYTFSSKQMPALALPRQHRNLKGTCSSAGGFYLHPTQVLLQPRARSLHHICLQSCHQAPALHPLVLLHRPRRKSPPLPKPCPLPQMRRKESPPLLRPCPLLQVCRHL